MITSISTNEKARSCPLFIVWLLWLFLSRTVKKCQDLSKTVRNCQKRSRTVKNCQKLSRTVKNCQKRPRTVTNCQELSKTVKNCQEMSKTVKNCQKRSRSVKNGQEVSKTVKNCQKLSIPVFLNRIFYFPTAYGRLLPYVELTMYVNCKTTCCSTSTCVKQTETGSYSQGIKDIIQIILI